MTALVGPERVGDFAQGLRGLLDGTNVKGPRDDEYLLLQHRPSCRDAPFEFCDQRAERDAELFSHLRMELEVVLPALPSEDVAQFALRDPEPSTKLALRDCVLCEVLANPLRQGLCQCHIGEPSAA